MCIRDRVNREAVKKYNESHPTVHREAVKKYNESYPTVHRAVSYTHLYDHSQLYLCFTI